MNFFSAQEQARKSTRLLVLWFCLGLVGVISTIYLVVTALLQVAMAKTKGLESLDVQPGGWWNPDLLMWTALIAGTIIIAGSLSKLGQLSTGGKVVAKDLGGRRVDPSTGDLKERQLLNVVEEMAIASGIAVPDVWIMDQETSINAFAAGTDPANAVIGVTRGTLDQLSRQELQGVIAHEFSHILNGDMKLNMRLTGWIFGLVMLSIVGRMLLHSLRFMRGGRDSKGNGLVIVLAVLGITVWLSGLLGSLFARIMQAAISRQREFLADASAVQFTRDPSGISGALKKIGGISSNQGMSAAKADEARHMFFSASSLSSIYATHPPLEQRIKAIDPNWDGKMLNTKARKAATPPPMPQQASGFAGSNSFDIGNSNSIHQAAGAAMIASLPEATATSHQSLASAKALLLGLLIARDVEELATETLTLRGVAQPEIDAALKSSRDTHETTSAQKLALIDRSLPALRSMEADDARSLIANCQALADADGHIDLFEFMMLQVIRRNISIGLGLEKVPAIRHRNITSLENQVAQIIALFGSLVSDPSATKNALHAYREHTRRELPTVEADFASIADTLAEMDAATPLIKSQILRLCSLVVCADGVIEDSEFQLLRAIADAIGASMPPLPNAA